MDLVKICLAVFGWVKKTIPSARFVAGIRLEMGNKRIPAGAEWAG